MLKSCCFVNHIMWNIELLCPHLIDIVILSQPYDFLSLIPVIEGAGGVVTDWKGNQLHWEASPDSGITSMLINCKAFLYAVTVQVVSLPEVITYFKWSNQIDQFSHKMLSCFCFIFQNLT